MTHEYNRFNGDGGHGSYFVMGLLTGTVLGAGLAMLFAPKPGSELRSQLSDQADSIANTASKAYRRATEVAGEWAERGREAGHEAYDKARDAVQSGTEEAQRFVRHATDEVNALGTESNAVESTRGSSSFKKTRGQ